MLKIFSLNSIENRKNNLSIILPNILSQADLIYVNLIGYKDVPSILKSNKIIIKEFNEGGSELRFLDYNNVPEDSFYFTIDDDILYPINYTEQHLKYNNGITCVHGCNISLNQNKDFYKTGRKVFHFKNELTYLTKVMIPGVGTSCFNKSKFKVDIQDFHTSNMSDPFIASFAKQQDLSCYSIPRPKLWLKPLNGYGTTIFGNNPYNEIDHLINNTFNEKFITNK